MCVIALNAWALGDGNRGVSYVCLGPVVAFHALDNILRHCGLLFPGNVSEVSHLFIVVSRFFFSFYRISFYTCPLFYSIMAGQPQNLAGGYMLPVYKENTSPINPGSSRPCHCRLTMEDLMCHEIMTTHRPVKPRILVAQGDRVFDDARQVSL